MKALWQFITDNKDILTWIGGGLAVAAGGMWTAVKYWLEHKKPKSMSVTGGVGAGRNISRSTITITNATKPDNGPAA